MRIRALPLVLCLLASACSGAAAAPDPITLTTEPINVPEATTTTTTLPPTTTTTLPATTTTIDPGPPAPLTGLTGDVSDQQVLIAKISNAEKGRPQVGINEADLVMEVLVEGGIGRWLAVYQTTYPETVGPLRSLREVDPKLIEPFDARVLSSGGQALVRAALGRVASDEGDGRISGFYRDRTRPAVYDMMFDTEDLPASGWDRTVPDLLEFDPRPPSGGEAATEIDIRMSTLNRFSWTFDHGTYVRFQDGEDSVDADGAPITADTVVVVTVRQLSTGRVDSAGSVVPDYDVDGSGPALVFRNGKVYEGEWIRESLEDFFRFETADGEPITLQPGRTWFHIMPESGRTSWD
ncbi:MAG: DUF3048 domain-containing protein [Acidimicrobiia bacterium]|nr:DUF3048 domain-containing protein [Acidimicrobiia bacterium]NNF09489.1 DUF3048 domain-containing protein [Acidimicrobiia bacterium]NNL68841.1 DUF3048 domain-containing protein [Acidimicrobiia bacterium]